MTDEKYIDLITGYLQGTLNTAERRKLNNLIEDGKIDIREIKEMELMLDRLGSLGIPEPGDSMRERFYSMLETEQTRQQATISQRLQNGWNRLQQYFEFRQLVYASSIFLIGLFAGDIYAPISDRDEQIDRLSTQISQMREVMAISLLNNSSPIERLKAVNISTEIQSVDDRVITALLKTLNNDSNVNVRVAAVEALVSHASNPKVRTGLINSIATQESPIVQAALADAMLALQEKHSVDEFKKLLQQNELDQNVRDKLENTIAALG